MKKFYKTTILFLTLCFVSSTLTAAPVDETEVKQDNQLQLNIVKKIDAELSAEKIQKAKSKLYKKLKNSTSEQKQSKFLEKLSKSKLSPNQQAAVLEVLEMYKEEINVIPEETPPDSK
jgi:valyl-tRNA synthetase